MLQTLVVVDPSTETPTAHPLTALGEGAHDHCDGQSPDTLHGMTFAWQWDVGSVVHEQFGGVSPASTAGAGSSGATTVPGGDAEVEPDPADPEHPHS
jgi:hypothetical protein